MLKKYPDVLDTKMLKEILRFGKNKINEILKNKIIPSKRIGRKYLILKADVIRYLKSNEENTSYKEKGVK